MQVSERDGKPVIGYDEDQRGESLPAVIAAAPDGGSWLAWRGKDAKIHLTRLGCDNKPIGRPTTISGLDLHDIKADKNGAVLLLTRKGDCHTGALCGSDASPCNAMFLLRFDPTGKQLWERKLTDDATVVPANQHDGRLAPEGDNYAAYFRIARPAPTSDCTNMPEGDRTQVIDADGNILQTKDTV